MKQSGFYIYDASAGSGKTYTLAKAYLKILLSSTDPKQFRKILAITFTNKAVKEMKHRITEQLVQFSNTEDITTAHPMFIELSKELGFSTIELKEKAKLILKNILHNYAFFDISTIDRFTHRLIRTFAKDLDLTQNFEVTLDTDLLLQEAVDNLLHKAGTEPVISNILLSFAKEKAADDKHWDIGIDLFKVGKLLFNENHIQQIESLRSHKLEEFDQLKQQLYKKKNALEKQIISSATQILALLEYHELENSDFIRGSFPKFIKQAKENPSTIKFDSKWKLDFENAALTKSKSNEIVQNTIEDIRWELTAYFNVIKAAFYAYQFTKNCYNNIVPVSVINAIFKELEAIEEEKNQIPITKFNALIQEQVKDQPAPFIYERLGEKYQHYFIDEFQDTSEMQWQNLIPLVANAIEGGEFLGSLMLVGDAKQSIYRWRGGKAEQFLSLINKQGNPFFSPIKLETLPKNYRSYSEIINFNNAFFSCIAKELNHLPYQELYINGNKQETNTKQGGFVELTFINTEEKSEEVTLYCEKVLEIIKEVSLEKQYALRDICILTRKKKHGILLAEYLMSENIAIVSSETLLLKNSVQVQFLVHIMRWITNPEDLEIQYSLLESPILCSQPDHNFIVDGLGNLEMYFKETHQFHMSIFSALSTYEALEYTISKFNLQQEANAHLFYFMDEIFTFSQQKTQDIFSFLSYWDTKKDRLAISAPEDLDAVQIMTVHKSKGLEFPIVIFPFANDNIYEEIDPKLWVGVNTEQYAGFNKVLLSKKQEMVHYNKEAENLFLQEKIQLQFDAYNILYVAMTRAEKALYIITKDNYSKSRVSSTENYPGLFIHYLQSNQYWQEGKENYTFGFLESSTEINTPTETESISYSINNSLVATVPFATKKQEIIGITQEKALERGNLIHNLMAKILYASDLENALIQIATKEMLTVDETAELKQIAENIINHPKLTDCFKKDVIVYNEKDIFTEQGIILRPDRVSIKNNTATILDYKTGKKDTTYQYQIKEYANALDSMGYTINAKLLIYITGTTITLQYI